MATLTKTHCFHCGDICIAEEIKHDDKNFCCNGCYQVYSILINSKLGTYYKLNPHPGDTRKIADKKFSYLDEPEIEAQLIGYKDSHKTIVSFYIPAIHCSSCIWLLERLHTINPSIIENRVDFLKKQVDIQFNQQQISLSEVATLLQSIGYEPLISLQDVVKQNHQAKDNLLPKIAVAGFCFGNVMLLSFPAYFGLSAADKHFGTFFSLLSILFCIPAVLYSGIDYFKQAYYNLKNGVLNIDFPLALGILVMFLRTLSAYIFNLGEGFADSLTGLIFFLLIGKFIQKKTYYHLSFERDYRSFFPVAVQVITDELKEISVPLEKLKQGDRILVKNQEIIPADAILLKGGAAIDFSFVTGESEPVRKVVGEIIYAGGKQTGSAIELEVIKPVSQSYLTGLWNNEAFVKPKQDKIKTFSSKVSKIFSIALVMISVGTLLYWLPQNWQLGLNAFTAILIVACPCALALSTPFTMAAALSVFDKNKFYLKNTDVVEQLAAINSIVFDKTGTVTIAGENGVTFSSNLNQADKEIISNICKNSTHPLSQKINSFIGSQKAIKIEEYCEIPGAGMTALVGKELVGIGSCFFVTGQTKTNAQFPEVHVKIGDRYLGYFAIRQKFRPDLNKILTDIDQNYQTYLLSGDTDQDAEALSAVFKKENLLFKQSPQNKLDFIYKKQQNSTRIMMIGDGLNDAGALKQSDAGIAVTDHINNFTPGSDAILDGASLHLLPKFLRFSKSAVKVIHYSFFISLSYNLVGISIAMTGQLSPLIAAIIMPLSTVTIISFTSIATHLAAKKHQLIS